MISTLRQRPFLLGIAIGLMVNLCLMPMVSVSSRAAAQFGDDDGDGGGNPFCQNVILIGDTFECIDGWVNEQQGIWIDLFGAFPPAGSFDFIRYQTDSELTGTGTYSAANYLGAPFTVRVYTHMNYGLTDPGFLFSLSPEELNLLASADYRGSIVLADFETALGQVGVMALSITSTDTIEGTTNIIVPIERLSDILAIELRELDALLIDLGYREADGTSLSIEQFPPPVEITGCPPCDLNKDGIDDILENHPELYDCYCDLAGIAAQTLNDEITAAENELDLCVRSRGYGFMICAGLCAVLAGPALPVCLATCMAGLVTFGTSCLLAYNSSTNNARTDYDNTIGVLCASAKNGSCPP